MALGRNSLTSLRSPWAVEKWELNVTPDILFSRRLIVLCNFRVKNSLHGRSLSFQTLAAVLFRYVYVSFYI